MDTKKVDETVATAAEAAAATATAVMFNAPAKTPLWKRALKWTGYAVATAAVVGGGLYAYNKYAGGQGDDATPAE